VNQPRATRRGTPRPGGVSPVLQIGLVALAVLVGFFILRNAFDDDDSSSAETPEVTDDTSSESSPSASTTEPPVDLTQAAVLVVNGAGVEGLAGTVTTALNANGVTNTLPAATATERFQGSGVYAAPGFESQAQAIANMLGITSVQGFPAQFPLADPNAAAGANVVVIVGTDLAGFTGVATTVAGTATTAADTTTTGG
jgi:LytR cell envelope-related transcriptional attenuator